MLMTFKDLKIGDKFQIVGKSQVLRKTTRLMATNQHDKDEVGWYIDSSSEVKTHDPNQT